MCHVKVLVRAYYINTHARAHAHHTLAYAHEDYYNVRLMFSLHIHHI
jgi:hypothetical protein